MSLTAGTKLGPYEILSPLGAGGMGEVYRARDTRLARDVAIKVLPEDSGRHLLVMELIRGETMRELLGEVAMPTKRLLAIAAQVADGLAKAHEAGIVHRDLKPENVMVTGDGFAKILDFGLAKLMRPEDSSDGTMAPTISRMTEPGVVMGTVAYMSPEQALGKPLDFRSDQFSFGSMLYEMLTGMKAFVRASGPETMAAIIRDEPESLASVKPGIPFPLRWIVERCLAKDPDERYASTRDLARDLARLRDGISEAIGSAPPGGPASPFPSTLRWAIPAALILLAGLAGVALVRRPRHDPPVWQALTFRRGTILRARFAPDGQTVMYAAAWEGKPLQLYSTRLDSTESTAMPFPSANIVGISRGGKMAITLQGDPPVLAEVPLAGGAPRELLSGFAGADWVAGEEKLAVVRKDRLEFPIGNVIYEPATGHRMTSGTLRASPTGNAFAVIENDTDVVLVDRSGKRKTLSDGWETVWSLAWHPKTEEVWFSARAAGRLGVYLEIHAVSLSGEHRVVARESSLLMPEDILPDGRVLVKSAQFSTSMMCLPSSGVREVNLSWLDFSYARDLSADGKWILFDEAGVGGGSKGIVYLRGTDGSGSKRLGEGYAVALSPDGRSAISLPSLPGDRLVLLPTGAGEQKEIRLQGMICNDARWFPDSKRILVSAGPPGQHSRLFVLDLDGGSPRPLTPEGFEIGPVSPDGKFAAVKDPKGAVVLWPVEGGEPRPLPGTTAEDWVAQWEGTKGLYLASGKVPVRIDRYDLTTGKRKFWKELGPADTTGVTSLSVDSLFRVIVTPDGKSYAYSFMRDLSQLFLVTGLE